MTDGALRLHGYPVSNYFNIARAALIEKQLEHDIVMTQPTQDDSFLAQNPMGKIPVLESPDGWIGETVAILEYLDDRFQPLSLRPSGIADRAKARQIINILQIYVEIPVRNLFSGVFADGVNSEQDVAGTRETLDRSTKALSLLLQPQPYFFGSILTSADLFAFYNLDIADRVTRFVYGRSIVEEIGTLGDWQARMVDRSSNRVVLDDFRPYFAQYLTEHCAPYVDALIPGQPAHA